MNRREFLKGAALAALATEVSGAAVAAEAPAGGTLARWRPGEFQIHVIHTGAAEAQFLIFPDGTTALIDCGDLAAITRLELAVPVVPGPERLAGEWIARYVERVNPNGKEVDWIETTHWHSDHTGSGAWQSHARGWSAGVKGCYRSGFALAAELLVFRRAIDRGFPAFDEPVPPRGEELSSLDHMRRLYAALAKRDGLVVEKFRLGAHDQLRGVRGKTDGFDVFNLCANGKIAKPDGSVVDCYRELLADGRTWVNENAMSLGHIFTYGKFRYFTAGDFSDRFKLPDGRKVEIETELAAAVPRVDVAKFNHHGHYSMPNALVKALGAQVWTACVWDQLHTVPDVLNRVANPANYPDGTRPLIVPSVFPEPRLTKERGAAYFQRLAPECFGKGCHVVVTVPPGGENYTVTCVDAADERGRVLKTYRFASVRKA